MTHPSELLSGTKIPVGLGVSTVLPDIDFETYSEAGYEYDFSEERWRAPPDAPKTKSGLGLIGALNYAMHPTTEILSLAYNLKCGRGPQLWLPKKIPFTSQTPLPFDLLNYVQNGGLIEAWNSQFEFYIWNYVCVRLYGFPPIRLEQLRCALGKARANSYPPGLAKAGEVMKLVTPKDAAGDRLIKKLSIPRNPTKNDKRLRNLYNDTPSDYEALYQYNLRDIEAEAEASSKCPDLEGEELEFWLADQRINRRGVRIDCEGLNACVDLVNNCLAHYDAKMSELTNGLVSKVSQLPSLKIWLRSQGIYINDGPGALDEEAIDKLLDIVSGTGAPTKTNLVKDVLEIRKAAGSASVKKVFAIKHSLSVFNRLHDLYQYHGARTGRPTGEGPQPTNLPKAGPSVRLCAHCERHSGAYWNVCTRCSMPFSSEQKNAEWGPYAVSDVLNYIKFTNANVERVEHVFGNAMLCVSGCLRGLFTAAPGHDLIAADFSSIESVVTACLSGEDWRVDVFHTHGKIYELGVSKISGIPFADIMKHAGYDDVTSPEWWTRRARKGEHHPLRQTLGKVSELASGFGGWINAWKRFGADEFMNDEEIKQAIISWRTASLTIPELWGGQVRHAGGRTIPCFFGLEGAFIQAMLIPNTWQYVMRLDGTYSGIAYIYRDSILYCRLPSGRDLKYHNPRLIASDQSWRGDYSLSYQGYNTNPMQGTIGWVTMYLYGGKACENVVQAVARDIQRYAIINLEKRGYPVILHTYDENVAEVPEGYGSIDEFIEIMSTMPEWARYKGRPWPIRAADGYRGKRYKK